MLAKRRWAFGGLGAVLIFSCVGCSSNDDAASDGSNATTGGSTGGTSATGATTGNGGTTSGGTTGSGGAIGSGGTTSGGSTGTGATAGATGSVTTGGLRWVGRVDATVPEAVKFAWQGSGFLATVKGTTLTIKLQVEGPSTVYYQPVIDGTAGERFNVDPGEPVDVTLATGLTDTDHAVELYRETEGAYGVSTFLGFTAGTPAADAPAPNERLIEVVGDSISAGYGNLGSELHPNWVANPACSWTAENSSWYATYAAVAGRALGAEVSTIARSGWGISRDRDGGTNVLPNVYENALGTEDPSPWSFERQPSVVVVNLGTNDFNLGDPGMDYETAYVDFIATLRGHYPDAHIFLTSGSMLGEPALSQVKTHLTNVVATVESATGDTKLVTFDMGTQNLGADGSVPSGCDWHPSAAEHERMAGILKEQLSANLGW